MARPSILRGGREFTAATREELIQRVWTFLQSPRLQNVPIGALVTIGTRGELLPVFSLGSDLEFTGVVAFITLGGEGGRPAIRIHGSAANDLEFLYEGEVGQSILWQGTNHLGTLKHATLTDSRIWTLPDAGGTLALATDIDVARTWATLQTFKDTTFKLVDDGDNTKTLVLSLGGAASGVDLVLAWAGTIDRTLTFPDRTGILATLEGAQAFTGAIDFNGSAVVFKDNLFITDGADVYVGSLQCSLTSNRDWDFPDASGVVVLASPQLTSGRVPFATTDNRLVDDADLTFAGDTLTATKIVASTSLQVGGGAVLAALTAGTYTPTRSAEANLDANVTPTEAQYIRVGNTVTVSGRVTGVDPTLAATATSFELSLPIASNIGAAEDLAGVAFCGAIAGQGAEITGSVANNTAVFTWRSGDITSQSWSYTFSYQVI